MKLSIIFSTLASLALVSASAIPQPDAEPAAELLKRQRPWCTIAPQSSGLGACMLQCPVPESITYCTRSCTGGSANTACFQRCRDESYRRCKSSCENTCYPTV